MSFVQRLIARSVSAALPYRPKAMVEPLETRRLLSSYSIAEITLGGDFAEVKQLNEAGQVSGYSITADGTGSHAFIFTDANDNGAVDAGEMVDLGTLGGTFSEATLLNEAGQAAGYSFLGGENPNVHAFLYTDRNNNGAADAGEMLDLGSLGGSVSQALFLNEAGQVAGASKIGSDVADHAFLFTDANDNGVVDAGEMVDLGTLGGSNSFAIAMNESGQVAGNSETADGATHAYLYSGGQMLDLGTLGGSMSFATGMNNAGQVIGYSYTEGDAEAHAFIYTDINNNGEVDAGEMQDLGSFGGTLSQASFINDAGQVAGFATVADGSSHAFLFTDLDGNGLVDAGEVADLGNLGGLQSTVSALNEAGQVAGFYDTAEGGQRAFLYTDANANGIVDAGELDDLGTLGGSYSLVSDLTEDGRVIGFSSNADDTALFAYVYTDANNDGVVDAGEMQDLNYLIPGDTGWVLEQPVKINEAGDIVGVGYKDGVLTPFLVTQLETPTPEEPATVADVEALVTELVQNRDLGLIPGVVLLTTLRVAGNQIEAGHPAVARVLLNATKLTVNVLHNTRRLSDEDYESLVTLLDEVIATLG